MVSFISVIQQSAPIAPIEWQDGCPSNLDQNAGNPAISATHSWLIERIDPNSYCAGA
jgi:hypothetical protein